jgi:NADPH:quinone reductase-like Zn-dependent oxidoreductase
MKAVRFHEYGAAGVLRYEEAERPKPGAGEVLVKVAAFNPVDTWFRSGIIRRLSRVSLPHTVGLDLAGTVIELGDGVSVPAVGQAVAGFLPMTGPAGKLRLDISGRRSLADTRLIHEQSEAGAIRGRVVLIPEG